MASQEPVSNTKQTWLFHALDTLFFRESRPMDSLGNSQLGSLFPPSARTLVGAIRTALGEANMIDWHAYRQQKHQHPLAALIGYGNHFSHLRFTGVWLHKDGQRLYPAPQNMMQKSATKKGEQDIEKVFFLPIANELTRCDLGSIRLPLLKKENAGSKPLNNIWLTEKQFQALLIGKCPDHHDWVTLKDLLVEEPRIGIARDNRTRSVEQGKLYQTKHIRLADDVQLAMDVTGLDQPLDQPNKPIITPPNFIRLGGEGRIASINVENSPVFMPAPLFKEKKDKQQKIALYLLTPLLLDATQTWQPLPDFRVDSRGEQTVWIGTLNGIDLVLHSAITGKAHQEGGWDLVKNKPKAVQSYMPAGSVFYCTTKRLPKEVIKALHGQQIGNETTLGRGMLAVGEWVDECH